MTQTLHTKFAKSLACAGLFATLLMFAGKASAQSLLYYDDFTTGYTVGTGAGTASTILTNSSVQWAVSAGTNTTASFDVLNTSPITSPVSVGTYTAYYNGGGGDYVVAKPQTTSSSQYTVQSPSNTSITGSNNTYMEAFLINVSAAPTTTTGANIRMNAGAGTTNYFCEIEVKYSGTTGMYYLGVSHASANGGITFGTTKLAYGTTYLVVAQYTFTGVAGSDIACIWVDPVLSATTPSTGSAYATALSSDANATPEPSSSLGLNICLRSNSTTDPTYQIDAIRQSYGSTASAAWSVLAAYLPLASFTTNPSSVATCPGNTSFIAVATANSITPTYQWQRSTGGAYSNITSATDGGIYGGYTTGTLTLTGATSAVNGYTYQCVATNLSGSTTSSAATLTVYSIPTSLTASALPNPICATNSLTLSGSASGATSYTWGGPNGYTASGASPAAITTSSLSAGVYTFTATTSNSCSVSLSTTAVTVNPLPAPTISGGTTIPSGNSTTLYFNGVSGDVINYTDGTNTYTVTVGGTGSVTATTGTLTVTTTYSITSATSAIGCPATITGQSAVVNVSTTPVAAISGGTTICNNGTVVTITFTGTPGAQVTYNEDGGASQYVTLDGVTGIYSFTIAPTASTTFNLTHIHTSTPYDADISGQSATITVNALPLTPGAILGANTACVGGGFTLSDAPSGGAWSSTNASAATIDGSGNVTPSAAGTTTISYTFTSTGCGTNAATIVLTVNGLPSGETLSASASTVTYPGSATLTFTGTSGDVITYTWNGNSAMATIGGSGTTTVSITPSVSATYSVTSVTNAGGCTAAISGQSAAITLKGAGLLDYDDFSTGYTVGSSILVNGGWANNAGSGTATFNVLNTTPITSPGTEFYNGGGSNYVYVNSAAGSAAIENEYGFTQSGGTNTYYFSFLLNVASGGASSWNISLDGTTTNYFALIGVKPSGGGYELGVSKTATTPLWGSTVLNYGQTYVVVVKYVFTGVAGSDAAYLWVNPNIASEPATGTAYTTAPSGDANATLNIGGGIILRSLSASDANFSIDAMRLAYAPSSPAAWAFLNAYNLPAPSFTTNPANTSVCNGGNTTLTTTDNGAASSYQWQENNGGGYTNITGSSDGSIYSGYTTSTLTVTGATTGINGYTYRLVAANTTGTTNSTPATLTVNTYPTGLTANASPNPVCNNSNLTLTGSATGATSYAWAGPASYIASVANPAAFATTTGGVYTFTATNAGCSTTMATATVTINPLPAPTVSASPTDIVGVGSSVLTISGNPGDVVNYTNGTSTYTVTVTGAGTYTTTVSPSSTTTYSITAATSALGCATAITGQSTTITVGNPAATISGATTICNGGSANLSFSGTGGATVHFTPDGSTDLTVTLSGGGSGAYTVSPTTTTTYSVTSVFYSSVSYTVAPSTATVSVNPLPASINGTFTICGGNTTTLTDATTGGVWSSSSVAAAIGSTSGSLTGAAAGGTSTISYILPTSCYVTNVETVNPTPTPTISGPGSITAGGSATLTFSGTAGTVLYYWNGSASVSTTLNGSGSASVTVTPSVTTTYSVTSATSTLGCSNNPITGDNATVSVTGGGLLYYDDFSTGYTIGSGSANTITTNSTNKWYIFKGPTGTADDNVANTSAITSPSGEYYNGGGGNYVLVSAANTATQRTFGINFYTSGSDNTYYYSYLLNVTSGGAASYNIALDGTAASTNYFAKTSIKSSGSGYVLGTSKSSNTFVYGSSTLNYGQTYLVVLKYVFTGVTGSDGVYLWVNPAISSEPATGSAYISTASGTNGVEPSTTTPDTASIILRSDNATGDATFQVDAFRLAYAPTSALAWTYLNAYAPPVPVFSVNPTNVSACAYNTQTFTGSASNASSYQWQRSTTGTGGTFANITSAGFDAGVTYSGYTTGTLTLTSPTTAVSGYAYQLVATNPGGTVTSTAASLTLQNGAIAKAVTGGGNYCPGGTGINVGLSGSQVGVTYQLYNGASLVGSVNGTGSGSSSFFGTYTATGTYTAVGTYTATGCSTNMTSSATVGLLPVPTSTITGTASICPGNSVTISATGTAYSSIYLSDGINVINLDGSLGSLGVGSVVISPTVTTTYTGSDTATCFATSTGTVVATVLPNSGGAIGNTSVCGIGNTATLTETSLGGTWSSSNTSVATIDASLGIATAVSYGTTTVTYLVTDACGSYSATATVTVNASPTAPVLSPEVISVCPGSSHSIVALGDTTGFSVSASYIGTVLPITATYTAFTQSVTVTGIPAGATITAVSVNVNVSQSASAEEGDLQLNLMAPNGNVICIDAAKGGGSTYNPFANIDFSSNGTTAQSTSQPFAPATAYLWSGATSIANSLISPSTYTVSATTLAALVSGTSCNGTWTLIAINSYSTSEDTLDNFNIYVTYGFPPSVTWSPSTGLYTNSGVTTSYTGTNTNTVYAKPVATTVYTVTAALGGCTASSTVNAYVGAGSSIYVPPVTASSLTECVNASVLAFSDSASGGTWSSSNTGIATVGSSTGVVTGIAAGSANITYNFASGACSGYSVVAVTINALPAVSAIANNTVLCLGGSSSVTLTDATAGGTWSSSTNSVATISSGGMVTAVNEGNATITYTYNNGTCTNTATAIVTVSSSPSAMTVSPAVSSLCPASLAALLIVNVPSVTPTYVVSSGPISSLITSLAAGYRLPLTVGGIPSGITPDSIDVTFNATMNYDGYLQLNLEDANSHIINILNTGTSNRGSNFVNTTIASVLTTVNAIPNSNGANWTGYYGAKETSSTTVGSNVYTITTTSWAPILAANPNGTWYLVARTNSTNYNATITSWSMAVHYHDAFGGAITWSPTTDLYTTSSGTGGASYTGGVTTTVYAQPTVNGSYTFTATATNGACASSGAGVVNLNSTLVLPAISGANSVCIGGTVTLSDATPGGTWSSSNTGVVTIGSSSGAINSLAAGTSTIVYSYTGSGGCSGTTSIVFTVNPLPTINAIGGSTNICLSSPTTTLTDATAGGVWSSGNTSVATVGTDGVVTGIAGGVAPITYTYNNGTCSNLTTTSVVVASQTSVVTMNPVVASFCPSSSTPLMLTAYATYPGATSLSTGAISTSVNSPTVAVTTPLNVSGIPTGAVISSVNVTLNFTAGSYLSDYLFSLQAPNNNVLNLVNESAYGQSATTSFTNTVFSSTGTASISASPSAVPYTGTFKPDAVNGVGAIPSNVTSFSSLYSIPNGNWTLISENAYTAAAVGTLTSYAITINYTYSDSVHWSSSSALYTNSVGTNVYAGTATDTVYILPSATTTVTATALNGACATNNNVVVNVSTTLAVSPVTGASAMCAGGATTTLSDITGGGVWSTSDPTVATIGSTGVVTSVGSIGGTVTISYTLTSGSCSGYSTATLTVNPLPVLSSVSGTNALCYSPSVTATSTLTVTPTGGTWSSSNTGVATVGSSSGIISATPLGLGTSTITYAYSNGTCANTTTAIVSVNWAPSAISLSGAAVCANGPAVLLTTSGGGTPTSAVFSSTGVYTLSGNSGGGSPAIVPVPVSLPSGAVITNMIATMNLTNGAGAENGDMIINLQGANANIYNLVYKRGGSKALNFNNTSISSVGTTSLTSTTVFSVTGTFAADAHSAAGPTGEVSNITTWGGLYTSTVTGTWNLIADESYTGTSTGQVNSVSLTVYYYAPSTDITWSPSTGLYNDAGATSSYSTTPTSGTIYALPAGNTTYTATSSNGFCASTASASVTVNPVPSVAAIGGTKSVCINSSTVLNETTTGGVWSNDASGNGTVDGSGNVAGLTAGTVNVTYSVTNGFGCTNTTIATVTVNPTPAISGIDVVCAGNGINLSDNISGGIWSSSMPGVATIGSSSGVVIGVSAGTTVMSYVLPTGCNASVVVTINPLPSPITGPSAVCIGSTIELSDATTGGYWWDDGSGFGTVDASGNVTGVSSGATVVFYTLSATGCTKYVTVTVNPTPAISGIDVVCAGNGINLSDNISGGTWSSSMPGVATIGLSSGVVIGVSAGTTVMSYVLPTGCNASVVVTINPLPSPITGPSAVCTGSAIQLSDATTGGYWWTDGSGFGTVDASGNVTGVSAGATVVFYTLSATGCTKYVTVTVNPTPAISGIDVVCAGNGINLSDNISGGTWSSSMPGVATIGSSSGVVIGVSAGTAVMSYVLPTGCNASVVVTINPLPSAITGPSAVCTGSAIQLSDATTGGYWWTDGSGYGTIDASGNVTGVSAGATVVFYTLSATGCTKYMTVTVNPTPAISGIDVVCAGNGINLSDNISGGTWSSSMPGVASIGLSSGVVIGVSAGTAVMSYVLPTGCNASVVVTINPLPSAISGSSAVCAGSAIQLSDATTGGYWWTDGSGYSTIDASGNVTGVSAGATVVFYTLYATGCTKYVTVTVNPLPIVAAISGPNNVCLNATIVLGDVTTGVSTIWSSSASGTAPVTSGSVLGAAAGNAVITYSVTDINGCTNIATKAVTVNPLPIVSAISGSNIVCAGAVITLSDAPTGGVWSSDNIAAATAGSSSGLVTGAAAGSAVISYVYTDINSCQNSASVTVTVNPQPTTILGARAVCIGLVTSLSDATTGGSWSNSNSNGTVDASGNVTGMTAGMVMISYAFPGGCYTTAVVTVNSLPGIVTGTVSSVCVGTTTTLSDATAGGTWSSANTSIATVGSSSRIVTGQSSGITNIIYTTPAGCSRSYSITVNTVNPVTGTLSVCANVPVTLNDASTGGTWTSGNTTKAAVGTSTGIVTGVSAGTSIITYNAPIGCQATAIVTVSAMSNILGTAYLCANGSTSLSDAAAGGTWSVSPSGIATVGTSGSVSGVSAGTATISYSNAVTGCATGIVITVNPMSAILSSTSFSVCAGLSITLNDATSGGTWANTGTKVSIGATSGLVTAGASAGTSTISYIISATGCNATTVVTVNPITPILGVASVCTGLSTSLSDATTGGVWSNDVTGNGTVSVSGAVTGVTAGTATISYTISATGCASGVVVMVNQTPTILSAPVMVCAGSSAALNVDVTGGTWSSTLIAKASIGSASGIINGVAAGTTTISYTAPTGCKTATVATVNALPSVITGAGNVCTGSTIALADASTGGVWSNDVIGNGTVDGSGNVTGITAGTVIISYTNGSNCSSTIVMTVNQLPSSFAGASVCAGSTTTLSSTPSGGVWSSSSAAIATVGSTSGVLTGVSGGTANIMYATGSGCVASAVVSVNTILPITGGTSVCTGGGTTFLADASTGGTWSTSDVTINVDPTGVVTPLSAGTGTVTYAYLGCTRSVVISVNPPPAITGTYSVCLGTATTLTGNGTGGTWSGSNAVIAMVGGTTGIVTGANLGTATITYASGPGAACIATQVVTVEASVTSISGVSKVCFGLVATLSDATTGGTWSSNNPVIGSVDGSGNVLGVSAGSTTISYRDIIGCYTLHTFTVNPLPGAILGTTTVCAGSTTTLSDATSGAVSWTSSNTSAATVTGGGVVTTSGSGSGQSTTITYAVASGCTITTTVSVITGPVMITNNVAICPGSSELLSDGTPGGSWSSSNTSVAAIGTDGTVSGLGSGNTTISYMLAGAGCQVGVVVTVAAVPPVTGTLSLCAGSTTMLNNTVSGGTWSTVSGTVSVGSSTGIVSGGASAATATVSYTTPVGCVSSAVVTVNGLPGLSGTMSLCGGAVTTLTATLSGGTWSGGNAHATVDGSGDVTGIASGTASVTYTSAAGCVTSSVVTVNIAPGAVSGITSICAGATTTLTDATAGGVWSSSNAAINIGSSSGVITGSVAATSTIAYTTGAGCVSSTVMSVNEAPGLVTGTTVVCAGVTVTLSESSTDGTWSSSNGNATVDGSGDVTGTSGATGAVTVSYSLGDGCTSTLPLSVVLPPSAISGNTSMCPGTMATLSDIPSGGTWSSSASGVASVGSLSGVVTAGGAGGTATIVYNVGNGCPAASAVITVYAAPSAIGGTLYVCLGATTTLTGDFGGTWSSSNSLNASVGSSSGIVTGVSLSTASITYTAATGCKLVNVVTVNAVPQIISGPASVCLGSTTMLTDATTGGVWSSTGTAGSVDASGNITGITAGMFTVNYTLGSCPVSRNITVNAPPSAIQGVATICAVGLTTNLSDATSGAVSWSSDNTANATVNGGGVVTGVALGTATIRYTVNTGCSISTIVTVGVTAISISGNAPVCPSGMLTLSDATGTVGVWSSANTGVATVGTSSGTVTGVAGGTATISYVSGSTGCKAAVIVTVNPILPITGTATACIGSSSKLADATTGGTWSSSATGIASVGSSTGIVTGGSGGVANITYLTAAGCSAVATVTINPISTTISGPSALCTGSTITFTDATTGGTWSSGNTVIATVGASTGLVTPANAGTVNISYSISGCSAVQLITVSTATGNIAGVVTVCAGATTLLTDATTGGVWSNTGTAGSVSATGNVTGITAGTITVSYLVGSCGVSRNVTVNPLPSGIGGNAWVCAGSTTALSDATTGATGWASSNTTFATVNGGGVVTGVAAGTSTIKYSIASGCSITTVVTVNGLPSATISGPSSVASGGTITLVDATTGGTWASSNHLAGTIGSVSGIVTGIASSGTTTISYTTPANSSGCIAKGAYTVTATPAPPHHGGSTVSGTTTLYVGSTASIIADVISGVWSSSNTQVATVDEGGLVTGVAPGVASITHVITNNQGDAETTVTPVVVSSLPIDVRVVPNPNSGTFTVKGILGTTLDEEVSLEITDVLGQVIYKSQVTATGGRINETISLSNTLANGMYLLNVSSGTEKKVFHFVIEK